MSSWLPTPLSLPVSPAAQRHETVHEGLPQPRPGGQLQLGGHWGRAASCGQPGAPPVQPHRLEEEKTHPHEGQPARQSQQIILLVAPPGPPQTVAGRPRRPQAQRPASSPSAGPLPAADASACPRVVVTPVVENSSLCSSVKPYPTRTLSCFRTLPPAPGRLGWEPRAGPGPASLGTASVLCIGYLISRCQSNGDQTPCSLGGVLIVLLLSRFVSDFRTFSM